MAIGDIGTIIESRDMWGFGNFPSLLKGPGNLFIQSQAQDARLRTFTIDDDGRNISAMIESLIIESGVVNSGGNVLHIAGDVYAFCYQGNVNNWIVTFTCDANGNIGAAPIASFNLGASAGGTWHYTHFAHVYGNIYVASYTDNVLDGWMATVQINDNGTFGGAAIATWEWQTDYGRRPFLLNSGFRYLGNQTFINVAVCVTGVFRGYLGVIEISDAGAFAGAGLNILFNPYNNQTRQQIFQVAPNIYVVFDAHDNTCWMQTFSIVGGLAPVQIDFWEWEPTWGSYPTAIDIGYNAGYTAKVFCATKYGNAAEVNHLKTIAVNLDGTIQKSIISSLAIDTDADSEPHAIVHIDGNYYAVLYYRPSDGRQWVKTVEIETLSLVAPPTVTTNPATAVGATIATLNGTLDADGGEACDCGFEYGESAEYGTETATQSKTTGETFSQEIRGLRPGGILYHFRAIATNSEGTSYGADRTFRTSALSAEAYQALGKGYALGRAEV